MDVGGEDLVCPPVLHSWCVDLVCPPVLHSWCVDVGGEDLVCPPVLHYRFAVCEVNQVVIGAWFSH